MRKFVLLCLLFSATTVMTGCEDLVCVLYGPDNCRAAAAVTP